MWTPLPCTHRSRSASLSRRGWSWQRRPMWCDVATWVSAAATAHVPADKQGQAEGKRPGQGRAGPGEQLTRREPSSVLSGRLRGTDREPHRSGIQTTKTGYYKNSKRRGSLRIRFYGKDTQNEWDESRKPSLSSEAKGKEAGNQGLIGHSWWRILSVHHMPGTV